MPFVLAFVLDVVVVVVVLDTAASVAYNDMDCGILIGVKFKKYKKLFIKQTLVARIGLSKIDSKCSCRPLNFYSSYRVWSVDY